MKIDTRYAVAIDKAYKNYVNYVWKLSNLELLTHEEFINKCQIDDKFGDRWGCKIEIKELSLEERGEWDSKKDNVRNTWGQTIQTFTPTEVRTWLNEKNIPTRLITITYNDKTIESYE